MNRDHMLKIYAVLMAAVMWAFVITRGQSGITIEVPVTFENIPAGLAITEGSNTSVRVTVTGHERFLRQLGPRDIKVTTSLEGIKKGENTHILRLDGISVPPALKVTGITPSTLHLRVEETASKSVPVVAALSGLPAEGYAVKDIIVEPSAVTVEGVRSSLRKIKQVYTNPVDIMSSNTLVQATVELDMTGLGVSSPEKTVNVSVSIVREKP